MPIEFEQSEFSELASSTEPKTLYERKTYFYGGRISLLAYMDLAETPQKNSAEEVAREQENLLATLPHMVQYLMLPDDDPRRAVAIDVARGVITDLFPDKFVVKLGALESSMDAVMNPSKVVASSYQGGPVQIHYDPSKYLGYFIRQFGNIFAQMKEFGDKLSLGSSTEPVASLKNRYAPEKLKKAS